MKCFTAASPAPHLMSLPALNGFRSARSPRSPFSAFLTYIADQAGIAELAPWQVRVPPSAFAELREATRLWAKATGRVEAFPHMVVEGVTAPVVDRGLAAGHAAVVAGGAA